MIVDHSHIDTELREHGWSGTSGLEYKKNHWELVFDTSSWMMPFTRGTRLFDVHVPSQYEAGWTVNLIEHLCATADENARLRAALQKVQAAESLDEARRYATEIAEERS